MLGPTARASLTVVILDGQSSTLSRLNSTIAAIRDWPVHKIIATVNNGPYVRQVSSQLPVDVVVVDPRERLLPAMTRAAQSDAGTWVLWLWSGERISERAKQALLELSRIDVHDAPVFTCRVNQPGMGHHASVDRRVRDEVRLHRTSHVESLQGTIVPRLDANRFVVGVGCAWSDIVIERPAELNDPVSDWACSLPDGCVSQLMPWEKLYIGLHLLQQDAGRALEFFHGIADDKRLDDSERAAAYAGQLSCFQRLDQPSHAEGVSQVARGQFPGHPLILYEAGLVWQMLGRHSRAIGCFRAAEEGNFPRGFAWADDSVSQYKALHQIAVSCYAERDYSRAEELWMDVLRRAPCYTAAHVNLLELFVTTNRGDAAIAWAKLMQRAPALRVDGTLLLAKLAALSGDLNGARRQLERGVRQFPDNPDILLALADHFCEAGLADEASAVITELLYIVEPVHHDRLALAGAHIRNGQIARSRNVLASLLPSAYRTHRQRANRNGRDRGVLAEK